MTEYCTQCRHDVLMHFFEKEYPDYCFCQISSCNCTCEPFKEKRNSGRCSCGDWSHGKSGSCGPNGCYNRPA